MLIITCAALCDCGFDIARQYFNCQTGEVLFGLITWGRLTVKGLNGW